MASSKNTGYLCHACAKATGKDPFKKPSAPKKRKAEADKRKVINFEEPDSVKGLAHLCIEVCRSSEVGLVKY